jgi:hypothetical protein
VESAQPEVPAGAVQPGGIPVTPNRTGRSAKDMALSMAVLLIPVLLLLVGYRVFFAGDAPVSVDPGDAYATAKHDAHFTILEPVDLAPGWTSIAAKFEKVDDGSVLRVSYVPPDSTGLQLVESDRPVDSLLPDEVGSDSQPGNLIGIAGQQWRAYPEAKGGGRALVLTGNGYTTVIIGTATDQDMRTFAASLR